MIKSVLLLIILPFFDLASGKFDIGTRDTCLIKVACNNVQNRILKDFGFAIVRVAGDYDVKAFGAKGDGITDDAAAINALAARLGNQGGGVMYFPQSTYRTGAIIKIPSNVRVKGAGMGVSKIIRDSLLTPPGPDDGILLLSGNNSTVSDITVGYKTKIINRLTYVNAHGVIIGGGSNCHIYRVESYYTVIGIVVTGSSSDCTVEACYCHDTSADGISVFGGTGSGSKRISLINNKVYNAGDDGISCDSPFSSYSTPANESIIISGNDVERTGARGVAVWGGKGIMISQNIIRNTYLAGIGLVAGGAFTWIEDVNVSGNLLRDAAVNNVPGQGVNGFAAAILLEKTEGASLANVNIEGNEVLNCQGPYVATVVAGSKPVRIESLTIRANKFKGGNTSAFVNKYALGMQGLALDGINNLKVSDNEIENSLQEGIAIGGSCSGEVTVNFNRVQNANLSGAPEHASAMRIGSGIVTVMGNVITDNGNKITHAVIYAASISGAVVPAAMNQFGGKAVARF